MKKQRILFIVSIVFNIVFILFTTVVFLLSRNMGAVTFLELTHVPFNHSAFIVSVPAGAEMPFFGAADVLLRRGDVVTLQLSTIMGSRQFNQTIEPLFDPSILRIQPTGYGVLIEAVNTGESTVQVFSALFGFRDLLKVYVYE